MKLIITRHGETEENLNKIWQGHLPGKLTKKGIEQARKLANRLKDKNIDVIMSSDLARASDTAKEIAKFHKDVPIYFTEDLRERFLGYLQGKKITKELEKILFERELCGETNIESIEDIELRAKEIIKRLLKNFSDNTILLIGHLGINCAIKSYLLQRSWEKMVKENSQYTSVTIFEFDKDKNQKLILMNCAKHLEELK